MSITRKPEWLKKQFDPIAESKMTALMRSLSLHTVCEDANCPNRSECFKSRTATFLILGDVCTRGCRYCAVAKGAPALLDPEEPQHVAEAAEQLGLRHIVVTSVTRDDLPDGGAEHFAQTILALRERLPQSTVEVLIPDFQGVESALDTVLAARPDILNHNLETVERLQPSVRPQADYARSLSVLRHAAQTGARTKSGLMLGMGETDGELLSALRDLRATGVSLLTLGQYLAPSSAHHPVARFVTPSEFDHWRTEALALGFFSVASAPHVRSSYHAEELMAVRSAS